MLLLYYYYGNSVAEFQRGFPGGAFSPSSANFKNKYLRKCSEGYGHGISTCTVGGVSNGMLPVLTFAPNNPQCCGSEILRS